MISLIIYGLLAAGAVFGAVSAWHGIQHSIAAPFVAEQIAHDQQIVNAANKRADDAEAERDHAKSDMAGLKLACDGQSKQVDFWKLTAAQNLDRAKTQQLQNERDRVAAAPRIADLQAKAAAAPKLMACQEELGKAKEVLKDALRARRAVPPK